MGFIDTHSHIYEPDFADDREEVVLRAQQAGVDAVLLPNINRASIQPMLDLCAAYPDYVYPMMGLHPEDVDADYAQVLQEMYALLTAAENPYIAVGEVGLDFYWDTRYAREQEAAFEQQVEWALALDLPLVIHCRQAHREMVDILRSYDVRSLKGIFHCFGGTYEEAKELLSFEHFALGIGGIVTYKKSSLPEVLQEVPLQRIVLETDAPYLSPVPHRGKRNEPAFALHTATFLASLYNVSSEEVFRQTNENVKRVFRRLNV